MEWILRLNELFELIKSVIFWTIEKTTSENVLSVHSHDLRKPRQPGSDKFSCVVCQIVTNKVGAENNKKTKGELFINISQ